MLALWVIQALMQLFNSVVIAQQQIKEWVGVPIKLYVPKQTVWPIIYQPYLIVDSILELLLSF